MQRPTRDEYNGETSFAFSLQVFISFLLLLLLRIGKKEYNRNIFICLKVDFLLLYTVYGLLTVTWSVLVLIVT